jgi:hypothetical protein
MSSASHQISDIKILPRAYRSPYTGSPFDSTDILSIKVSTLTAFGTIQ